jgi:hypothetical protein
MMLLLVLACTDAEIAKVTALGSAGHITCYSGGTIIYEGESSGRIATETQSDGWFFNEKKTNRLVRISGDCVITD